MTTTLEERDSDVPKEVRVIERFYGGPYISQSIQVRWVNGITFGVDTTEVAATNSALLAAAAQDAYDRGKFLELDFSDIGHLAISSAVNITTSWYGGDGPMAEIRYVGDENCCVITQPNVTIQNVRFNRQKYRFYPIIAMEKDGSGNISVQLEADHPYQVGDSIVGQSLGENISNWARDTASTIATVNGDTIIYPGGSAAIATYDVTRTATLTAAVREGGYLIFTTSATHYFYPGQKIRVNGHIKTGALNGVTSPQTLDLSTSNVDSSGFRGYINGVTTTSLAVGHSVWTDTGEIPAGTLINDIVGSRIYLSKLITGNRTGASVIFSRRTMDVTDARVERIYSTTKFAVLNGGVDDTAVDVNSATVSLHETQGPLDRVPCIRMSQVNAGTESNKSLLVKARGVTLRDVEVLGTSLYTFQPEFMFDHVSCLDTCWDTFGFTGSAVRGEMLRCRSGLTTDDGMVILGFNSQTPYPGQIYIEDYRAYNNTKGHGLKVKGARVLVDSMRCEYSETGFSMLYDPSGYGTGPANDVHVRNATLRGCGLVDPTNSYAMRLTGSANLRVDNMEIIDSNNGAIGTSGQGIRGGSIRVNWTRTLGGWTVNTGSDAGKEVDIDTFDIKETYDDAIFEVDGNRGSSFRIGRLLMEDINRSEAATGYGLRVGSTDPFRGRIEIGEWVWTKQRYINTSPITNPTAASPMISAERSRWPWDLNRIGTLLTQRAGWVPIAKWSGDLDDGSGATGDKAMTILPAVHGYRSILPGGLVVRANDAAATCTGYGDITVRDAISGGGNLLVAGGKTWLSLNGSNPSRNLSEQLMAIGTLTSGSPTVQFSFEGGTASQNRPTRMDEIMPGMDVTGTGIPANTYVTGVDRSLQQITLSANATTTGGSELTFTGAIPQNVTLDIAVDGSTPTIYLVVTGLLTGNNLDDCDVYLIGRMGY